MKAGWQKGWHPCGCQSSVVGYIASAAVVKRDAILSLALRQFAQVFGGLSAQDLSVHSAHIPYSVGGRTGAPM